MDWSGIEQRIGEASGMAFRCRQSRPLGGGSINQAWLLEGDTVRYFVKLNSAGGLAMFEAEAEGLAEIARSNTLRVPQPICWGLDGNRAFLVLEYIPLGHGGADSAQRLGEALAAMHQYQGARFGWYRDNTIGATPQYNDYCDNWVAFWRQQRLLPQLELLAANGFGGAVQRLGERVMVALPQLLADHPVVPSLLHGDLWSGNYGFDEQGAPVIFDPAVYYGDREADLAMTELFGGFPAGFYQAYQQALPLDRGYPLRKILYNLYHILNHANLFGSGYLGQAESMARKLLSEMG